MTFFSFLVAVQAQQFTLVNKSNSKCRIIIPQKATAIEIQAALVFQDYIQRISGVTIPIESDKLLSGDGEILIGNVNREELKNVPLAKLEKDGLYIKTTGKKLVIAGGTEKGILYGVYTFLEKYLGCRKYTATVDYIPKQKTIILNSINDMQLPAFTYREILYPANAHDPEYLAWHKLDNHTGLPDTGNEWGSWVHTFNSLLNCKEYGESHPEYFSFYNDERHPGNIETGRAQAQLCLTNPDVMNYLAAELTRYQNKDSC